MTIAYDVVMFKLLAAIHDTEGAVAMGEAADLFLEGIKLAIAAKIGPDKALALFEKHISPRNSQGPKT